MDHFRRLLLGSVAPLWDGAGEGTGGGGAGDPAAGGAGAWAPPADMPKEFVGRDQAESFTRLYDGYKALNTRAEGLRNDLARRGTAPEKPENYTFRPSDKIATYFPDVANDKALAHARAAFHKHGVPDAAFQGVIEDMYGPMIDAGLIPAPINPQAELAGYGKQFGIDSNATSSEWAANKTFATGLAAQLTEGVADPAMKAAMSAELAMLTETGAGNAVLRLLSKRFSDAGFRLPDGSQGGSQTGEMGYEEASRLNSDPRIDPSNRDHADQNRRFDPDLRARWEAAITRGARK